MSVASFASFRRLLAATVVLTAGMAVASSRAATRASTSYSIAEETVDLGGGSVVSSAAYSVSGTAVGQKVAGGPQTSTAYTDKSGYVGQLYDVRSLSITASPTSVNERATTQLAASPMLDDLTFLASLSPGAVTWSVVNGPIVSVSTAGVVTAGTVYQNTSATVSGAYGGITGTLAITVVNINTDDYGAYAGDGIDDSWQVTYFGPPPNASAGPLMDADGTGQSNLFKYLAGLNPLDANARFILTDSAVTGQPGEQMLTFFPVYSGRTYTLQSSPSLTQPNWTAVTNAMTTTNGTTRTVTDLGAGTAPRFYRVLISMP